MIFNMNEIVMVKLTDVGINELKRQHDELAEAFPKIGEFNPPKTDDDGWSQFQLWDLMERLGHMCKLGSHLPFETDIKSTTE